MAGPRLLRRKYVVPAEHGSWVWWLGPFVVGLAAGGRPRGGVVALFVAALAAFLLHQPAAVAVKALVRRYPPSDLKPALTWVALLAAVALAAVPCLVAHGEARALVFAGPGLVLFGWHLQLVARREERRHVGMALLSGAALACAAPAAYVVAGGTDATAPWVLLALGAAHTSASIVTVYHRLPARPAPTGAPAGPGRVLAAHAAALGVAGAAVAAGVAPPATLAAFALAAADGGLALRRPARPPRPAAVGARQLAVDVLFTLVLAAAWRG